MGSNVIGVCKCGYEKEALVGTGKLCYKNIDYFPCFCRDCCELVNGNFKGEKLKCPNCNSSNITPYNNEKLIGKLGKDVVVRNYDDILTDGFYLCPDCLNHTLKFYFGGILWD